MSGNPVNNKISVPKVENQDSKVVKTNACNYSPLTRLYSPCLLFTLHRRCTSGVLLLRGGSVATK
eukprot:1597852-Amphidinium_carterae.1